MITSSMEIITPEKAKAYLETNTNNYRCISKSKVDSYAEDIRNGNWKLNGETIVFGANGELKDGQHRLSAVVSADKPIMCVVVRGVENDIGIFDAGMTRTLRQIAKAEGLNVTSTITGAANIIFAGFQQSGARATVKQYIGNHIEEFRKADEISQHGCAHGIGRKAACSLVVYIIRRFEIIPDDVLYEFFWIFNNQNTNPNIKRNHSPALVAARTFQSTLYSTGSGSVKKQQANIILQAMNDFNRNANRIKAYDPEKHNGIDPLLSRLRGMDGIQV